MTFTLFKKNHLSPFQVFKLPDTSFMLGENDQPSANITRLDQQSAVSFSDYNFDGIEDLSLCDGRNGGYGAPSYQIYLFLPRAGRFILSEEFTELSQTGRLGELERDARRKRLRTFSKSGCCLHMTEEFVVVNNRPKKVLEIVEDATIADEKRVKITTKAGVVDVGEQQLSTFRESHNSRAQSSRVWWRVRPIQHEISSLQHTANDLTLHADAFTVNDADRTRKPFA